MRGSLRPPVTADPIDQETLHEVCAVLGYDPARVVGIHLDPTWVVVWVREDGTREHTEYRHPVA